MRISDWSSDVCSSDLSAGPCRRSAWHRGGRGASPADEFRGRAGRRARKFRAGARGPAEKNHRRAARGGRGRARSHPASPAGGAARSEEHTSELQSLMRISYAVFCLKKKKKTKKTAVHDQTTK